MWAALLACVAALIMVCGQQGVRHHHAPDDHSALNALGETMNRSDSIQHYRAYLATFGIAAPGERIVAFRELDFDSETRFFAYADGAGIRLKAAVTLAGLVTPGAHADDDWYGLLSSASSATAAAQRLAWLQSDQSVQPHGLPRSPALALEPGQPPKASLDPAQWALVTAPTLLKHSDGSATLTAWLLTSNAVSPIRWTITARAAMPATIARASAAELLAETSGGKAAAATEANARARKLLATGTDREREWALQHIGDADVHSAVREVSALLSNASAGADLKILATGVLARLADPSAIPALGVALREEPSVEVRRACAHALGRLSGSEVVQALASAASQETDVIVRLEIVHALAAQGSAARPVLDDIARRDTDLSVRNLAREP
jgi:hypothetical protein